MTVSSKISTPATGTTRRANGSARKRFLSRHKLNCEEYLPMARVNGKWLIFFTKFKNITSNIIRNDGPTTTKVFFSSFLVSKRFQTVCIPRVEIICRLLEFMRESNFEAPKGWLGYRNLNFNWFHWQQFFHFSEIFYCKECYLHDFSTILSFTYRLDRRLCVSRYRSIIEVTDLGRVCKMVTFGMKFVKFGFVACIRCVCV